jgi:hypothetical protein
MYADLRDQKQKSKTQTYQLKKGSLRFPVDHLMEEIRNTSKNGSFFDVHGREIDGREHEPKQQLFFSHFHLILNILCPSFSVKYLAWWYE